MAAQLGWLEGRGAAAIGSPQLGERSLEAAAVGAVARPPRIELQLNAAGGRLPQLLCCQH